MRACVRLCGLVGGRGQAFRQWAVCAPVGSDAAAVVCVACRPLHVVRCALQITECAARIATAKDGEARPPAFWKRQAEIYLIRYGWALTRYKR